MSNSQRINRLEISAQNQAKGKGKEVYTIWVHPNGKSSKVTRGNKTFFEGPPEVAEKWADENLKGSICIIEIKGVRKDGRDEL